MTSLHEAPHEARNNTVKMIQSFPSSTQRSTETPSSTHFGTKDNGWFSITSSRALVLLLISTLLIFLYAPSIPVVEYNDHAKNDAGTIRMRTSAKLLDRTLLSPSSALPSRTTKYGRNEQQEEDLVKELHLEDEMNLAAQQGDEVIRNAFGSDQYLRVCAPVVLTSVLCITIRYPFPVSPPPADGTNLFKVDERYSDLTGLVVVDGSMLTPCQSLPETDDNDFDEMVKKCLDDVAAGTAEKEFTPSPFGEGEPSIAVAVFTRRQKGEDSFSFFGTGGPDQVKRISEAFPDGDKVVVYGDSKSPTVGSYISTLWYQCRSAPKFPTELRTYCNGPPKENDRDQRDLGSAPWDMLDQSKTFIAKIGITTCHDNTTEKVLDFARNVRDVNATSPQQISVLIQYSIAHIVRQPDLFNNYDHIAEYQQLCVKDIMEVNSPATRAALADIGFRLNKFVVFDGIAQHFPTITGAYTPEIQKCKEDAKTCDSYPEWNFEEHGPLQCTGPVPGSSLFRKFLELERSEFMKNGLDMRWYGMSWEFTNLFWWQHRAWGRTGLDCTHDAAYAGGGMMYMYFLQAMIDDWLLNRDGDESEEVVKNAVTDEESLT